MAKMLIHCTHGKDDPERATLAFIVGIHLPSIHAIAAAQSGPSSPRGDGRRGVGGPFGRALID